MKIIVPSLGRAGTANSMKWLPQCGREIVFAVHGENDYDAYHKAYKDVDCIVLSDDSRQHTGLIRREIMQRFREPFFFVDDDIRVSLKAIQGYPDIFNLLEKHIQSGASMAGLAPQLFSSFANTSMINGDLFAVRNKFVATVYGINPEAFDTCPLEDLPVYEDIALVIHAIKSGGGTIVTYVATHSNVSPPTGGCNSWRDAKITLDSLQKICQLYPDVCSVKETNNTTHSQNLGVGLRVAWAKIKKVS